LSNLIVAHPVVAAQLIIAFDAFDVMAKEKSDVHWIKISRPLKFCRSQIVTTLVAFPTFNPVSRTNVLLAIHESCRA
jgi:hypothetical protein